MNGVSLLAPLSETVLLEGLYTLDQAAWMARVTPRLLRSWLDGEGTREPAVIRQLPKNDASLLSFIDFVQAMAIRAIRTRDKNPVSLQKIRATIEEARKLDIEYPFARRHLTYLFRDDVVIRLPSDREVIIQVTGKYRQHQLIKEAVELYMKDLVFDDVTGLAKRYTPLRDPITGREVIIDPKVQYGAPVAMPSGYTASALISARYSEGSVEGAAEAMEVDVADIDIALRYNDILAGTAGTSN